MAVALASMSMALNGMAASSYPSYPLSLTSQVLETKNYRLRMLTVHDLVKDFDAVISSSAKLREVWPASDWPLGLTLKRISLILVGIKENSRLEDHLLSL